jgi:hypothetical protein
MPTHESEIVYTELIGACSVRAKRAINGHTLYFRFCCVEWSLTFGDD